MQLIMHLSHFIHHDGLITSDQLCSVRLETFVCNAADVHIFAFILPFLFMIFFFLDNCKKFGLVFDNVVGIVEVINSRDIQIQVNICLKNKEKRQKEQAQHVAAGDDYKLTCTRRVRNWCSQTYLNIQ